MDLEPIVFFVDDDEDLRDAIQQGLELAGYEVAAFASAEPMMERTVRNVYGVLVTDIRMPHVDGLKLMRRVLDMDPAFPVILITGHGDVPLAVEAMRAGAYDFIEKPFPVATLCNVVARGLDKRRLVLENRMLREQLDDRVGLEGMLVGKSARMEALRQTVAALAATDADVLIQGETGSGKEVVARALHSHGPRADKPFVAINCGALPSDIIESELFGHEAGAFTGAQARRVGKMEHAQGGTIFLDEIESMPLDLQVKLLRVIESRSIERLGSNTNIALDVRFVAATKDALDQASRAGTFREDLYYRLNVVSVDLPPLRERREDIPLLFHHLAREARSRYRRDFADISPVLLATLSAQDWPGNVRELRNAADRYVLGLPPVAGIDGSGADGADGAQKGLKAQVAEYEASLIMQMLKQQQGSITKTCAALNLPRKTLYDKMEKYGLSRKDGLPDAVDPLI